MDSDKQELQGSPRRDVFKRRHKDLPGNLYGMDVDFCCIEKHPNGIAAFLDFKTPWESITFAEVIGYNALMSMAPVYIIRAPDPEQGPFQVFAYMAGNPGPDPPDVRLELRETCPNWPALGRWEAKMRGDYRKRAW